MRAAFAFRPGFSATTTSRPSTTPRSRSSARWACACTSRRRSSCCARPAPRSSATTSCACPPRLVERARATAPGVVPVFDRDGEPAMRLGGRRSYFGTGSDLMNIYDLETGERRLAGLADVARAARLCDGLPNIDFVMSCAYPNDVADPHLAYVARVPGHGHRHDQADGRDRRGRRRPRGHVADRLRACAAAPRRCAPSPTSSCTASPSSPLEHPRDSLDKLLFCADKGIPAIYSPAPLRRRHRADHASPGTSPRASPSRCSASSSTSSASPARRSCSASGRRSLDMATAQSSYNAPEYLMTYLGAIEMARWLDLPNWGYAGTSDAQLVDAQAGMEAGELTLLAMMAGSNLNHDVGYLDYGMTGALELVVIVDEFIAMNRRLLAGITVDRETLGVDVIATDRPGRRLSVDQAHRQAHAHGAVAADDHQPQGLRALEARTAAPTCASRPGARRCACSPRTPRRRSPPTWPPASTRSSKASRRRAESPPAGLTRPADGGAVPSAGLDTTAPAASERGDSSPKSDHDRPGPHAALGPALREALTGTFGAPELVLPWIDRLLEPDELRLVAALAARSADAAGRRGGARRAVLARVLRARRASGGRRPPDPRGRRAGRLCRRVSRSGRSSRAGRTCRTTCARALADWQLAPLHRRQAPPGRGPAGRRAALQPGLENAEYLLLHEAEALRRPGRARLPVAVRLPGRDGALPQAVARLPALRQRPRPGLGDLPRARLSGAARRRPPRPHAHRRGRRRRPTTRRRSPAAPSATAAPTAAFRSSPARRSAPPGSGRGCATSRARDPAACRLCGRCARRCPFGAFSVGPGGHGQRGAGRRPLAVAFRRGAVPGLRAVRHRVSRRGPSRSAPLRAGADAG